MKINVKTWIFRTWLFTKKQKQKTNTKLTSSPMEKLSPTKAIPGAKNVGDCWSRQKTNKETLDFILE